MSKKLKWTFTILGIVSLLLLFNNKQLASTIFGEVKYRHTQISPGNIEVPHTRTLIWNNRSAFAENICNSWADKTVSDNMLDGKGNAPRILLAKLIVNRDIPEVNKKIGKLTVWGNCGSSWVLNKKGDYDFTLAILTTIFWKFGDQPQLIYPETRDYLLNVLLSESGNKFSYSAPQTLGLVQETENHMLMTEGSRYLKNRWIMLHGNNDPFYDNLKNGMEHKILSFLNEMKTSGLYEFNSIPYIGYTITALLNLEAFASDQVKTEARNVLDYMNWCYALGSYQLKHYPPMRRRYEKAGIKELTTDYQSIFMKSWLSFSQVTGFDQDISSGEVHALMGVCMPYRPADKVVDLLFNKGEGYFIKLGHGPESSPEIFAARQKYLISAGGVNRGKSSLIVARPICLFLNDSAKVLSSVIHLAGPGTDFMNWNNTGVYRNFACAAGPVIVPESFIPVQKNETWSVYSTKDSLLIAVHSVADLGIIAVFKNRNAASLIAELIKANPNIEKLKTDFQFPGGHKIIYDVSAPKEKWVIVSVDGKLMDRNFDKWPLIEGDFHE